MVGWFDGGNHVLEQHGSVLPRENVDFFLVDVAINEQKIRQPGKARPATASVWQSPSDYAPTQCGIPLGEVKLGTPIPTDCLNAEFHTAG